MRARLLAVIILLVLVALPLGFYWYFFTQKVASLSISVPSSESFQIELQGTFSSSWFPLADAFLDFRRTCIETCTIVPIPPAKYELTITSTGKVTIHDELEIQVWESLQRSYTLHHDLVLQELQKTKVDTTLWVSLIENANSHLDGIFSLVGIGNNNKIYALRKKWNQSQLGTIFPDKFVPMRTLPTWIDRMKIDLTGKFFVAPLRDGWASIFALDMSREIEIPILPYSVVFMNNIWKMQTQWGVYIFDGEGMQENPRFTDFLDISPSKRLGYIAANDTNRLSLSNFAPWESVLVLLDRTNGQNYVIKRWVDIQTLFLEWSMPVYVDSSGKVWEILLDN
jgi:hypothetical protein